jgi:hypothetical protein
MMTIRSFLEAKRVSELQEIHSFWADGNGAPPARREELLAELSHLLKDQARVGTRLKVLAEKPLLVLHLLVRTEQFASDLPGLVKAADGNPIEGYEVEAAARALGRRGFLEVVRDRAWTRFHREVYAVPRELAETVSVLLMEDRRGPRQVFTLAGHIAAQPATKVKKLLKGLGVEGFEPNGDADKVAAALLDGREGQGLLDRAPGDDLRALILSAVTVCGGIVPRSRYKRDLGAPFRWHRKRWQRYLEENALGTVTTLGLSDCGIELEGETTVVFAEVVERVLRGLGVDEAAIDRVASARVDLLTDISHFLRFVAGNPIRVTHGRTIHRAAYGRILEGLTFREDALVERAEVFQVVYDLAVALGLVEIGEERVLALTRLGQGWDTIPLQKKVRLVYDHFLDERRADHRDFHDRPLRRLLAARLAASPQGRWMPLRTLPFLARNDYVAGLEEEGVRAAYRNRFQQAFDPPREEPNDLAEALVDWTIGRLYLLGVVDVGFHGQEPAAIRLTDQGRRLLGAEGGAVKGSPGIDGLPAGVRPGAHAAPPAARAKPLVVNPDFEILLLPEGDVNEIAHTLDRFAKRVRSDEVTRYRLQREDVERAIVQGMTVEQILAFLTEKGRSAIPQNVAFSVKEWGERVRFCRQREAVLLEVDRPDALDRALALEPVKALLIARLGPTVAALRAPISDFKTLEALKGLGVYLRG